MEGWKRKDGDGDTAERDVLGTRGTKTDRHLMCGTCANKSPLHPPALPPFPSPRPASPHTPYQYKTPKRQSQWTLDNA